MPWVYLSGKDYDGKYLNVAEDAPVKLIDEGHKIVPFKERSLHSRFDVWHDGRWLGAYSVADPETHSVTVTVTGFFKQSELLEFLDLAIKKHSVSYEGEQYRDLITEGPKLA